MHDPCTQAFTIHYPWNWFRAGYHSPLVTIWHKDPEKDGSDDSCGWFMRSRHGNKEALKKVEEAFSFEWDHGCPYGWFNDEGNPNYSTISIALGMFRLAANVVFGHWSKRADRFLRRHIFDILHFAENNCDSLHTSIMRPYGKDTPKDEHIRNVAACVYSWILRADRPRWKHPRWHVHHWRLQIHPLQNLKRRFWDKCCICGKRGFKGAACGNWDGNKIWHSECDTNRVPATANAMGGD